MTLAGRLKREHLTYTIPPISPLYPMPPIQCPGVLTGTVTYETDVDAAASLLPSVLQVVEPATVTVGIFHIVEGSLGTYYEANMFISALWEGEPVRYSPLMLVTNDMAMNYGREVLGVPKKKGFVRLENRPEGIFGYAERPEGYRLLALGIVLEREIDVTTLPKTPPVPAVSLRIIGQPEGAEPDTRVDLIAVSSQWRFIEMWTGAGTVAFSPGGDIDNWNVLPVKRIISASYGRCDIEIPYPRLIASL